MGEKEQKTSQGRKRLDGWKEIGAYLGRSERTAKRWEQHEGLPVHRQEHSLRPSVYAYPTELDGWREKRVAKTADLRTRKWPSWRPLSAFASTIALAILLLIAGSGPEVGTVNAQAAEGTGPAVRMIWSDETTDLFGSPSPNGRYLSFTDWDSGDLAVRDLKTGENRRLTNEATGWDTWAECSEWSPDGAWIAYDWYVGHDSRLDQVRLIPSGGGEPRILYDSAAHQQYTVVLGWSPDGQEVLVRVWDDETRKYYIGAVSVTNGNLRVIRSVTGRDALLPAGFSPDGGYILFTQETENGDTDVLLVSSDGKRSTSLVDHPAADRAIGWHPDGGWVLFESDRTGRKAVWALRVENGEPRGEPRLIVPSLPANSYLGITKAGVLFFGHAPSTTTRDIYQAEIDPVSGEMVAQPARLIRRSEGANDWPNFSRDGRFLAYVSQRNRLCILDLEKGITREFPTEFERMVNLLWGKNNDTLIFGARIDEVQGGLYRMDLETGQLTALETGRRDQPRVRYSFQRSPSGEILYYLRGNYRDKDALEIVARDLESGRDRVLGSTGVASDTALKISPDGSQLAVLNRADERILRVVPTSGGEPRELHRYVNLGHHIPALTWSADGNYLLLPKHNNAQPPAAFSWSLWRVRVKDGQVEELIRGMRPWVITAHPNGRQIAFSADGPASSTELWVMENFLPETGSSE